MRWQPGPTPDPVGGAHDAPPDPLVGWGGDTPPQPPTPLGAFGASIIAPSALSFSGPNVKSWLRPCTGLSAYCDAACEIKYFTQLEFSGLFLARDLRFQKQESPVALQASGRIASDVVTEER